MELPVALSSEWEKFGKFYDWSVLKHLINSPLTIIVYDFFLFAEGVTGCPPPDFKVSRGKFKSMTTEQPFVTFETTQLYLPQDFTTNDLEFVDGKVKDTAESSVGEQVDRSAQKDSSKVKENPFWFEDIIKDAEQHYNHPSMDIPIQHHHSHHHDQRVKRNHHKKAMRHVDNEKTLSKRSVEYQEEDYPQDSASEVFSASEVVGNIFNENDTLAAFEGGKNNGKPLTFLLSKRFPYELLS